MKSRQPRDPELVRFLRDELGAGPPPGGHWQVTGPLWVWRGAAKDGTPSSMAWTFLTIAGDVADAIRAASAGRTAAWGSVYVDAVIGTTTWRTSLFPSKSAGGYLLPVKAAVRRSEKLAEGDEVTVTLSV